MISSKFYRQVCWAVKPVLYQSFHTSGTLQAKVALVLSGCGVYDGAEIHEASACMVHLSRGGADTKIFAPNINQHHVVDHTKGEPANETRNVLVESARIARGNIQSTSKLNPADFDAVVFPGGFGAVKNLCNYALEGNTYTVNEEVSSIIKAFHSAKKPIGLCCISPMLAVKSLPGVEVTIGSEDTEGGRWPYAEMTQSVKALGCTHVPKLATEAHIDEKNKVVSTPAYMCETALHEIFDGIGIMISNVLKMAK